MLVGEYDFNNTARNTSDDTGKIVAARKEIIKRPKSPKGRRNSDITFLLPGNLSFLEKL